MDEYRSARTDLCRKMGMEFLSAICHASESLLALFPSFMSTKIIDLKMKK